MKYFYTHIIKIEETVVLLEELDLKDHHKKHLGSLIDTAIHTTVLDVIFSQLSAADKKLFIDLLKKDPSDKRIMHFLNDRVDGIEDQLKEAVDQLKSELHKDIKHAKIVHKQKESK